MKEKEVAKNLKAVKMRRYSSLIDINPSAQTFQGDSGAGSIIITELSTKKKVSK